MKLTNQLAFGNLGSDFRAGLAGAWPKAYLRGGRCKVKRARGTSFYQSPALGGDLLFHFCMRGQNLLRNHRNPRGRGFYRHHFVTAKTCGKSQGGTASQEMLRGDPALKEEGGPPYGPFLPSLPSRGSADILQPPPARTDSTSELC